MVKLYFLEKKFGWGSSLIYKNAYLINFLNINYLIITCDKSNSIKCLAKVYTFENFRFMEKLEFSKIKFLIQINEVSK